MSTQILSIEVIEFLSQQNETIDLARMSPDQLFEHLEDLLEAGELTILEINIIITDVITQEVPSLHTQPKQLTQQPT